MSKRRFFPVLFLAFIVIAVLIPVQGFSAPPSSTPPDPEMADYCIVPPFIGKTAPPMVMLMVQKDHKLFTEAYDDHSDLNGDGMWEWKYEHSIDYYGYFDSYKCYSYSSALGRFVPRAVTTNKYCNSVSGEWSGNFLNWASMTRMDVMRKVFYGGKRVFEDSTASGVPGDPWTVLERSFLPQDAHSFVKTYTGSDIGSLTPYNYTDVGYTLSFCNTTKDAYGNPPLMRVATGEWAQWAAAERWQCAFKEEVGIVVPLELVTNGSFDVDTAGWLPVAATLTSVPGGLSNNAIKIEHTDVRNYNGGIAYQDIATITGQYYTLTYSHINGNAYGRVTVGTPLDYESIYDSGYYYETTWRTRRIVFQATGPTTRITLQSNYLNLDVWNNDPYDDSNFIGAYTLFDEISVVPLDDYKENGGVSEWLRPDPRPYNDAVFPGNYVGEFNVRVEACPNGMFGKERCKRYEQHGNYMPIGLFQEYGEDQSMYFGLISGTYEKNKSGGILRSNIHDIGSTTSGDINRTTGVFTGANTGIIKTLDQIIIDNYDYATGTYAALDNCPEGLSAFGDNQCTNWGNPLGEMYYEAVRYFAGKTGDTSTYAISGTDNVPLPAESWNNLVDPYLYNDACAQPFVLMVGDTTPSYDSDQVPGGAFGSISGDLAGFDASAIAYEIGLTEGIYNGTSSGDFFVGQSGSNVDNQCTAKSISNLGEVRGICPAEPGTEGSYYVSSAAYFGRRNDVRDGTIGPDVVGEQNINAYAVVLGKGLPEIKFNAGTSPIKIIPACYNETVGKPCALVDFRVWNIYRNPTTNNLSGTFDFVWEDSQQGSDYDSDIMGRIGFTHYYATDEIYTYVTLYGYPESTNNALRIGYVISGTTEDGARMGAYIAPDGTYGLCDYGQGDDCSDGHSFYPGTSTAGSLENPLWYAAKYGGYMEIDYDGSDSDKLGPNLQSEWDADGNGVPDTYFDATKPQLMEAQLEAALTSMLRRVTSGTAASVLASGEGSGANLVQAVYYPRRRFFSQEINWLGSLQNLWYFVDPFFQYSSIREDTDGDKILNLTNDYLVSMYYDPQSQMTRADLYQDADGDGAIDDTNGDGSVTRADRVASKEFADIDNLWEAGLLLWERDLATDPRTIYYNNGTSPSAVWTGTTVTSALEQFDTAVTANLIPLMNVPDVDGSGDSVDETTDIINYTLGYHLPYTDRNLDGLHDYRNRYADIDLNDDGDTYDNGEVNEWKLGDIIDSTPKIASHVQIHYYDKAYNDYTYYSKVAPADSYVESDNYQRRGMVYVGANDGMLHAFKLGDLQLVGDPDWASPGANEVARLDGSNLGREEWAYIPLHVLPYLKYIAENDYCHLLSVDLSPYIFDASIARDTSIVQDGACSDDQYWTCKKSKDSWRTILIGGLRLGGACRNRSVNCSAGNCVNVPAEVDLDNDAATADEGIGYSSYFALDITEQYDAMGDPVPPKLLWEFSHDELGTSYSGPAIVRINGWKDNGNGVYDAGEERDNKGQHRNGRWIVVIGSGPTGPISRGDHQFLGRSDQNLKIFALDLKSGELLTHDGLGNKTPIDTGIPNAFAGSMINVTHDNYVLSLQRQDYEDELLYIGYTQIDTAPNPDTWTKGGIGRLVTRGSADPQQWRWSKLMENIGPVNAAVAKLENIYKQKLWVYFGTGRFFYKQLNNVDDMYEQRTIFGVKDPCYNGVYDPNCDTRDAANKTVTLAQLADVSLIPGGSTDPNKQGWYISLDDTDAPDTLGSERVITDVLSSTNGLVFFTTFQPYTGACSLGGKSYLWAVKYDSGGDPGALLQGKGLVQVSTGAIEEIDLRGAFSERGNRRTPAMEGVPPSAQGLSIVSPPRPVKRTIHVRER